MDADPSAPVDSVRWSRALFSGIEKGATAHLSSVSAQEWGRKQAAASPAWSEDKWRRIGLIFDVDFIDDDGKARHSETSATREDVGGDTWPVAA